jgi:TonB family protein
MKAISQLLLNFLVNAFWQIALIAAVASVCAWLIRSLGPSRRHALWVAALLMSLALPLLTTSRLLGRTQVSPSVSSESVIREVPPPLILETPTSPESNSLSVSVSADKDRFIKLNGALAAGLTGFYLLFILYRGLKLSGAWRHTRVIKHSSHDLEPNKRNEEIFARCQTAIGVRRVQILSSASVSVPLTVGIWRPLIILPERLLSEADTDVLTSAVGHELVHVLRRDFLLNLIYELIYLPLSFHPAAALVRRKINQTRELSCDELVARELLAAEVYAHSLVQLAGSAVPFGRRATLTVGITDADILEERIMSLLGKPKLNSRLRKLSLVTAALLLAVPVVAATAFGVRLDIKSPELGRIVLPESGLRHLQSKEANAPDQEKAQKRERRELEEKKRAEAERKTEGEAQESDKRLERNDQERAEKEYAEQQELKEKLRAEQDPQLRAELEARARRQYEETMAMRAANSSLARMAKITMEQAIQIANGQHPGKVMECSLMGQGWESPGKLSKDGHVLYHVVIISADELNPTFTHVMVNALDGTIFKTEKEERGKENPRPRISGGVLNSKAISMPNADYPAIARAAQASGTVKVQVTVDEQGNVIAARAVSGHPLLQAASVTAARQAKFSPTRLSGEPVQFTGVLIYNFVAH